VGSSDLGVFTDMARLPARVAAVMDTAAV